MAHDDPRTTSATQHRYATPTGRPCPRVVRLDGTIEGGGDCLGCGNCLQFEDAFDAAPTTNGGATILREWRARAPIERRDEYPAHFTTTVVPWLQNVVGFIDASLLERTIDGLVEFTVLTRWTSMDAVAAFAGPDVGVAVVEAGAIAAVTDYDRRVVHHRIIARA